MTTTDAKPRLLWTPPGDARESTEMGRYLAWLADRHGLELAGYDALWEWSVTDLDAFWGSIWEYFDVQGERPDDRVLAERSMPGARWFPGATLNYAEHALRHGTDGLAVVARSQTRPGQELSYAELRDAVGRAAEGLRRLGVGRGDRVVAYIPNVPEALVALLATASLGAIWSSCAPEFGTQSVTDRFRQIEPKVLLAVDGYRYGAKEVDRSEPVARIRAELPTLEATVVLPYLHDDVDAGRFPDALPWADLIAEPAALAFEPVPFDHPLWVLYSSGTTGLPKPIVHGHGGILLEHLKMLGLHHDLGPADRFFWFTTTGWMMWNYVVGGLLRGSTAVLFDGNPGHPDPMTLWRLAEEAGVTVFGVSAPFLHGCMKAGLEPGRDLDLARVRAIGSTGAPLTPEGFEWVYDHVHADLQLGSASGGTDVCTAFVGPAPLVPVYAGEIPCRSLGAKVEAFDAEGKPVVGERGELVITEPMPSMPIFLWGDEDGSRLHASYFDTYPGVWRHGDWITITERGSCIITGRSDATLNRGGVRMGTSEFYQVVEGLDGIADSLVVDLGTPTEPGTLLLFVVLAEDAELDDELLGRIHTALRTELSPRHVPDEVRAIPDVPRTLNGKKLEVPVKRILSGEPPGEAASPDAMANPESLHVFAELARG